MLPSKCCQYLMRMMSPLTAGLILALFITISSSQASRNRFPSHPQNYSSHTQSYFMRPSNHSYHQPPVSFHSSSRAPETKKHVQLPFSKDSVTAHRRIRPSTQLPSHHATNSSSKEVASVQRPSAPEVKLKSKFRVKNATSVNSTIVYFPRHSRAMGNFSEFPKPTDLQPIIVSSRRRILIDPEHFIVKGNSTSGRASSSSDSSLKKRDISPRFVPAERRNNYFRFQDTPSPYKDDRFPHTSVRKFNPPVSKNSANRRSSGSKLFVKTVNERENGAVVRKKSTVAQVSPSLPPRKFRPKNSRRERQFDLEVESLPVDKQYSSRVVSQSLPSKASDPGISNQQGKRSKLFEYTYSTGMERDWKPIAYLTLTTTELNSVSTPSSIEDLAVTDYGLSYTDKKAKNLTIYEILKPKLKSSDFTNLTSAEDAVKNGDQGHNEDRSTNEESSAEVNEIQKEKIPPRNSMVILPGRSDSSYGVEYVVVNRNESAVVSPLRSDESAKNSSHELADHRNGFENSSQTEPSSSQNENANGLDPPTENYPHQEPKPKPNEKLDYYQRDESNETQIHLPTDLLRIRSGNNTVGRSKSSHSNDQFNSSVEYIQFDNINQDAAQLEESESIRKSKMATDSTPLKNLRLDSKMFYDYFAKKPIGNVTLTDFPYPEFRPGNMFRYSDIYNRKPILDFGIGRPPPFVNAGVWRDGDVTPAPPLTPTTFNSLRTSLRVVSTFYPNRMQDVTMKFGNRVESTTSPTGEELPELHHHQDDDFDEYRDALEPAFTMEKLAYLLIGTCCGLSILCLLVVVVAIRCRRSIMERRLKAQFKKRMYYHEKMKDGMAAQSPWQQQMFDHFMYLHRRPGGDSSCSRSTESCNCRCVTWSLGARNLDSTTRPLFPNRGSSSSYLVGQKRLPFGAASTLRYESMLGRTKRPSSSTGPKRAAAASPNHSVDSSHENDSLDIDDSDGGNDGPTRKCTCIEYNVWPMPPPNVPRGFYTVCPGRYNARACSQHHTTPVELRPMSRDVPPPVTGSNYLDRSEGVVYWSSNDERLI